MVSETEQRSGTTNNVNTATNKHDDNAKRLPHERDESPDAHHPQNRDVMRQAASDLEQGLVDTDLHGERGVEKAVPAEPKAAKPVVRNDDNGMR